MLNTDIIYKKEKNNLSSNKKKFQQLIKTVKDLQIQLEKRSSEIDLAIQIYFNEIKPNEAILATLLMDRIPIAYQFYKATKNLSKIDAEVFKNWIISECDYAFSISDFTKVPDEVNKIYKELTGGDYRDGITDEIELLQDRLREEMGIDIDLSDVNLQGSQEEIMRNIFFKMGETASANREKFTEAFSAKAKHKPKTKKQIEKEAKIAQVKEIQSKSLHTIYKQLARLLHPDLEQDPQKRVQKEELMKKVTHAYDKNDLYELLTIQNEWLNSSIEKMPLQSDDELKIYNAILRDQIDELKMHIDMLFMHPKNISIQKFYQFGFDSVDSIKTAVKKLHSFIRNLQEEKPKLKTKQAEKIFKAIIREEQLNSGPQFFVGGCTCGEC